MKLGDTLTKKQNYAKLSAQAMQYSSLSGQEKMRRILVIDSEKVILSLFLRLFRNKGWKVTTTNSGSHAIKLVKNDGFKFIFLEYHIRDLDGLATFRIIKGIAPEVKVIMMFAYSREELIEEARKLGAERLLTKPFDLGELTSIVEKDY